MPAGKIGLLENGPLINPPPLLSWVDCLLSCPEALDARHVCCYRTEGGGRAAKRCTVSGTHGATPRTPNRGRCTGAGDRQRVRKSWFAASQGCNGDHSV